jgi:hypothetical protein
MRVMHSLMLTTDNCVIDSYSSAESTPCGIAHAWRWNLDFRSTLGAN